ncbi:MAG: hypothetical protein JXJ04_09030, partial [Spirochaetales bacterium]|nr:hypothetical protein [Spirochaetales bacterium]
YTLIKKFCGFDDNELLSTLDILTALQIFYVDRKESEKSWPPNAILTMLMGHIRENTEILEDIKNNLIALGIPFYAWVIDYEGHLYNRIGQETYEPIFHTEYLKDVAKAMWQLSKGIFGKSFFTYENLADEMRESDIELIKLALRRISIIINDKEILTDSGEKKQEAVLAGDFNWKWIVTNGNENSEKNECVCMSLKDVIEIIENLGEPDVK